MLDQPTQQLIFPPTTQLRAPIQILFMHGTSDMVVQAVEGGELFGAEVAFVGLAIPGTLCGDVFDVGMTREGQHRAGNDIVAVELVDHVVDLLAVEPGGGTFA
jgi:hypothetical protein